VNERQPVDLGEVPVKADEIGARLQSMRRDADVVRRDGCAFSFEGGADEARPVGGGEGYRQELDEAVGSERFQLGPVRGVASAVS